MNSDQLPLNVKATDNIILFDGVCKLCHAWSRFIIKHDRQHVFKLCAVQSQEGKSILLHFGFPAEFYETMLFVEGAQCFQQSDAFLRVMSKLSYPWKIACVLWMVPRFVRDWVYHLIALNRYRWFGKYNACTLPVADHDERFLKAK